MEDDDHHTRGRAYLRGPRRKARRVLRPDTSRSTAAQAMARTKARAETPRSRLPRPAKPRPRRCRLVQGSQRATPARRCRGMNLGTRLSMSGRPRAAGQFGNGFVTTVWCACFAVLSSAVQSLATTDDFISAVREVLQDHIEFEHGE